MIRNAIPSLDNMKNKYLEQEVNMFSYRENIRSKEGVV